MEKNNLLRIQINEKPENKFLWFMLSFQHIFAMFGATVLVPTLTGLDPSVAIFCSGVGTLIYITVTKKKVPVYLGSSFAYIAAISYTLKKDGPGGVATGLISVGVLYMIIAIVLTFTGTGWFKKIMPPVVVGSMIMVIGLGLANIAVSNAGLTTETFSAKSVIISMSTLLITSIIAIRAKGFLKIIPILVGIISGYIISLILGEVDTSIFKNLELFRVPDFKFPGYSYKFDLSVLPMFLPIAFVTMAEHIGDHTVLSSICGQDFITNPGLKKTLLGDGLATMFAGLVGGPANTTYGENTGVIAMTKVGSVYVIISTAILAIILSFLAPVAAFINSIPQAVMGGVSIMLFGIIGSNGVKIMIENKIDFNKPRNLIIASSMLILGLGGATFTISKAAQISGMSLSAIVGIVLNIVLPKEKN